MKREINIRKERGELTGCTFGSICGAVKMWIETVPNGEWVLRIEKKKTQRSVSQNALMWIWFSVIAQEWSEATDRYYSKESVKEFFCRKYLPIELPNGEVVGGSTSGLTTEQFTEFLNKIQAHAATEWGITLFGAEDEMFNEWKEQSED